MTVHRSLAGRLAGGCAALLLLGPAAGAQTDPPAPLAEEEEPPRYTVELIVFAYDESVPSGSEMFLPDEPLAEQIPAFGDGTGGFPDDGPRSYGDARSTPYPEELPELPPEDLDEAAPAAAPGELPFDDSPPARQWVQLQLHDEQRPRMNEIYERLVAIDAYRPLMRAAWTQTTHPRAEAPAIHLQSLGGAPGGLDGNVTLYVGRFVHLVLDLALDGGAPADRTAYRDEDLADGAGRDFSSSRIRYRLEEDRIMRMGEIRYFDHPRFGVIARVTDPEDGDQEAGEESDAVADGN